MESWIAGLAQHGYSILFVVVFLEAIGIPIPAALALLIAGAGCGKAAAGKQSVAITRVSVIDVTSGETNQDYTVLLSGNRIAYVGPAAAAKVPADARVIDGRGKFLIPGLWDMHVHAFVYVFSDFAGPLMIAISCPFRSIELPVWWMRLYQKPIRR